MISGHTYINRYKMLLLKIIGTFLKEFCYKLQAEVVDGPKAHHKETWWRNDDISNSVHNTRPPFCWSITFSHTSWKGGLGKNECLRGGGGAGRVPATDFYLVGCCWLFTLVIQFISALYKYLFKVCYWKGC